MEECKNSKLKHGMIFEFPDYNGTSLDTNLEAENFQISQIRQASTSKRMSLMMSLSKTVIQGKMFLECQKYKRIY